MSDSVDPSPYAPPEVASYPERLRREPATEEDRRLSSWWWLLPVAMFAISFALPTKEIRGGHIHLVADGKIAGFLASGAVACAIGSFNCFRQARVADEDGDLLRAFIRTSLGFLLACGAVVLILSAVGLFVPLLA